VDRNAAARAGKAEPMKKLTKRLSKKDGKAILKVVRQAEEAFAKQVSKRHQNDPELHELASVWHGGK